MAHVQQGNYYRAYYLVLFDLCCTILHNLIRCLYCSVEHCCVELYRSALYHNPQNSLFGGTNVSNVLASYDLKWTRVWKTELCPELFCHQIRVLRQYA